MFKMDTRMDSTLSSVSCSSKKSADLGIDNVTIIVLSLLRYGNIPTLIELFSRLFRSQNIDSNTHFDSKNILLENTYIQVITFHEHDPSGDHLSIIKLRLMTSD